MTQSINTTFGMGDASYQAAGGEQGIRQLVDDFYDIMATLDSSQHIFNMHPHDSPEDQPRTRDKLAMFLCGWLGGPIRYADKYGEISIPRAHAHLAIGGEEMSAWLRCMKLAADKQPYSDEFKHYLLTQLSVPAGRCKNQP
jgi:hemoglobin